MRKRRECVRFHDKCLKIIFNDQNFLTRVDRLPEAAKFHLRMGSQQITVNVKLVELGLLVFDLKTQFKLPFGAAATLQEFCHAFIEVVLAIELPCLF